MVIPAWQRTESHLFRQDVDAHLFHLAVSYGVEPLSGTRIQDIDVDPAEGVTLRSDKGEEFRARYLVDGSGFRSPVADKFGLRDVPTRARHHSPRTSSSRPVTPCVSAFTPNTSAPAFAPNTCVAAFAPNTCVSAYAA